MENDQDFEMLSTDDAADLLQRSRHVLMRWRSQGVGPTFLKIGGAVRYRRADLLRFLKTAEVAPRNAGPIAAAE